MLLVLYSLLCQGLQLSATVCTSAAKRHCMHKCTQVTFVFNAGILDHGAFYFVPLCISTSSLSDYECCAVNTGAPCLCCAAFAGGSQLDSKHASMISSSAASPPLLP